MGLSFGNKIGNGCFFGVCPIASMWFGNTKYYPASGSPTTNYITLDKYSDGVSSAASIGYITVSASTTAWTVTSSALWLNAYKESSTSVRYRIPAAPDTNSRTATLSFQIDGVTYATFSVEQAGQALYITLIYTSTPYDSDAHSGIVTVSANTPSWSYRASTNPASAISEFSVTKNSDTELGWSWQENTGSTQRDGFIEVYYGSITRTAIISQNAGCSIVVYGDSVRTIEASDTQFSITIRSYSGSEPVGVTCTIGSNTMNAVLSSEDEGGETGQVDFTFTCDSNSTTDIRNATITFTQTGACSNSTSVYINQKARAGVDGVTPVAYYGKYILGTVIAGQTTFPVGELDMVAAVIVSPEPIAEDLTAIVSMAYQSGPITQGGTPESQTMTARVFSIPEGSTVTYAGKTWYGIYIVSPQPRLQINQVTQFSVL